VLSYPIGLSGQTVHLLPAVTEVFGAHRQMKWWQRESGGMLFARIENKDIFIVEATPPQKQDIRSRFGFTISKAEAQAKIDTKHAAGLHYLGEWHTHPEAVPTPSRRDEATMSSRVRQSSHQLNGFIFAIVGHGEFPAALAVLAHDGSSWHQLSALPSGAQGISELHGLR
jgi:integrative and conjugative element protein (TIGR02256 family)